MVEAMLRWPRACWTSLRSLVRVSSLVARVCLKVWAETLLLMPASWSHCFKRQWKCLALMAYTCER